MTHIVRAAVLVAFLSLLVWVGWYVQWDVSIIANVIHQYPWWGPIAYIVFLAASVTLFPLVSLPILPVAAEVWGVGLGGTLTAVGWTIGAIPPFFLVRHAGRPVLRWFVSLHQLDAFEKRIPPHITFFGIVLLRIVTPVEIPSFALGLLKHLRFRTYISAMFIGNLPFSYLAVAMGGAIAAGQWALFAVFFAILCVGMLLVYRIWRNNWASYDENSS